MLTSRKIAFGVGLAIALAFPACQTVKTVLHAAGGVCTEIEVVTADPAIAAICLVESDVAKLFDLLVAADRSKTDVAFDYVNEKGASAHVVIPAPSIAMARAGIEKAALRRKAAMAPPAAASSSPPPAASSAPPPPPASTSAAPSPIASSSPPAAVSAAPSASAPAKKRTKK